MSLDLGALVGRVVLEDAEFQRTYARVMGQMRAGAGEASKAAAGVSTLDRAFSDTAGSASGAAAGIDRASRASAASAAAEQKAAVAAARHAEAVARVAAAMGPLAESTTREQAAALRLVAAQDRLNTVQASGTATTARLASAQASVIAAADRSSAASLAAMGATDKWRASMGGMLRTAGQFGVVIGAFAALKAAVDMGHAAAEFQQQMLQVQTMAGASSAEVRDLSQAVLAMAGQVAASPDELAKALYHIEQNGRGLLSTAQMLDALRVGAEGAKIGLADVEDTTNAMTIALASGIKGVSNLQQAMGFMLATVGTGDMRLKDLTAALSTGILSVAKGFGASLQDVSAVLATLGDNGIRSNEAAQALRQTLMGFAQPAKLGAKALDSIGLSMTDLRQTMQTHGLVAAMNQLRDHMTAAGVTGSKVGAFITEAFGRKAGAGVSVLMGEIDRVNLKFSEAQKGAAAFADKWTATTHTARFALDQLGAEAQAAGIKIATGALPAVSGIVGLIAAGIPHAVDLAGQALHPFADAWHLLAQGVGPVAHALGDVLGVLAPAVPLLEGVAGAALAMFVAFKGYQIARAAVFAVMDATASASAGVRNSFASMQAAMAGTASESELTARVMAADFAAIEAAAMQAAAAQARATAIKAQAFADSVAASTAATDAEVANADKVAAAAWAQAKAAQEAAAAAAASAETAAADIDAAGTAASAGWRSVLGPLGLAAIGVMTVVSMFHKSTSASQAATDAAKAYTAALSGDGSGGGTTIIDAITTQLANNNLPHILAQLNTQLSGTKFSGQQFVDAIAKGGPALDALKTHLQKVIDAGTHLSHGAFGAPSEGWTRYLRIGVNTYKEWTPAAKNAAAALKILTTQQDALSKATRKDLEDTKAFAGASSSIDKVAASTQVASKTAAQYAQMLGIAVDKNGVAAVSAKTLAAAVATVSKAYALSTVSGSEFLTALNTFSGSAGTASDRAALIGATLKAANGDALAFASAMNGAASAQHQLTTDIASAAKAVGKNGESTQAYLRAITDLKTGTINYSNAAAAPLINDMSSMQTAAMGAAQAMYQHERATKGATVAADDAYNVYRNQTSVALVDQLTKLGMNTTKAKKLADQYFGMPKDVKTLIEQEGANPIVDVLNEIGQQLAYLTHHPWKPTVDVNNNATDKIRTIHEQLSGLSGQVYYTTVVVNETTGTKRPGPLMQASGGTIPGTGDRDTVPAMLTPGEEVTPKRQATKYRRLLKAIAADRVAGYASGGTVKTVPRSDFTAFLHSMSVSGDPSGAFRTLLTDARQAGLSGSLADALRAEANSLKGLFTARNHTVATLQAEQGRLEALKQAAQQESQQVRGAFTGSVDITQAGKGPGGSPATVSSILADVGRAATRAAKFAAVLRKLKREGLGNSYLQQLAMAGPDALEQALALGHATPAQIAKLNSDYREVGAAGSSSGAMMAKAMYGAGEKTVQGLIDGLEAHTKDLNAAMRRLAGVMVSQIKRDLDIHSPSQVMRKLGRHTGEGFRLGLLDSAGGVAVAAARMNSAVLPAMAVHSRPAGVTPVAAAAPAHGAAMQFPRELVIVDVDGHLIGRMRVEAGAVVAHNARELALTGGRR